MPKHAGVIKDYTNVYVVCAFRSVRKRKVAKTRFIFQLYCPFLKNQERREYFSTKEEPQPMVNL